MDLGGAISRDRCEGRILGGTRRRSSLRRALSWPLHLPALLLKSGLFGLLSSLLRFHTHGGDRAEIAALSGSASRL